MKVATKCKLYKLFILISTDCFVTSFLFERRSQLHNYVDAVSKCKCGCLRPCTQGYAITNEVWEINQKRLKESKSKYKTEEKDRTMKQAMYNELKTKIFDKQGTHVPLEFVMNLIVDEDLEISKSFTLCEKCYVTFNDHICK